MEGIEADPFFTFFGLDAIRKDRYVKIKVATSEHIPPTPCRPASTRSRTSNRSASTTSPTASCICTFAYRDANVIPDSTDLRIAASFLNALRAVGKTVFIHCRLGLNRSALLSGLVLIDEGYAPRDAIETLRKLRSPYVLENKTFERYLLAR